MSLLSKAGLRRRLLALATFASVSALSAAPALADHGHHQGGGGFWFPPLPQIYVPLPPVVVVAGPHGHGCDYDDHAYYYGGGYGGGYGHGYRGDYRGGGSHHGHGRHYSHGRHGHGGHRNGGGGHGHRGHGH